MTLLAADAIAHRAFDFFEWASGTDEEFLGGFSARTVVGFVFVVSEISWAVTLIAVMVFDTWDVIQTRSHQQIEVRGNGEDHPR